MGQCWLHGLWCISHLEMTQKFYLPHLRGAQATLPSTARDLHFPAQSVLKSPEPPGPAVNVWP